MTDLFEKAQGMFSDALADDSKYYDPKNYKWFIGYEILDELKADALPDMNYVSLYNIEIAIDAESPRRLELWKKIAG